MTVTDGRRLTVFTHCSSAEEQDVTHRFTVHVMDRIIPIPRYSAPNHRRGARARDRQTRESANTKRSRNDPALARQDSAPSIPSSSDMISVKNIEDREDEYGKMKLALLSDIVDTSYNNGSFSPKVFLLS